MATERALIAIIENYQNENGEIAVPKALQSYMKGAMKIKAVL
jgi:seryl-tRNA synthetase